MKRLSRTSLITFLLLLTLVISSIGGVSAQDATRNTASDNIQMTITVNGLERGNAATLSLSSKSTELTIIEQAIEGKGDRSLTARISTKLKDGYYLLLLKTSNKYFRDPKGYSFEVYNSKIVNPTDHTVTFDLIPPSEQNFRPYRESDTPPRLTEESLPYMLERTISLSAPRKQPEPLDGTRSVGYNYVGPVTSTDNEGLWGRFDVVDPGVRHPFEGTEFVADRVFIDRWVNDTHLWMEIGWAEVDWEDDTQYMYEFDSVDHEWNLYSLPTGSNLEVRIDQWYGYWCAAYRSGGSWHYVAAQDLGFTVADNAYNRGEIYTSDGTYPSLPRSNTDVSRLYIDDDWDWWDTSYSTSTGWAHYGPYEVDFTTRYYDFDIYKEQ